MNLKTYINNYHIISNETSVALGQGENTITLFYKVDNDANVDGTVISYDLYIKHKSASFRTVLKDNDGVDFPTTTLTSISPSSSTTGYITINTNSNITLLDSLTYDIVLSANNTAGLSIIDSWIQVSSI